MESWTPILQPTGIKPLIANTAPWFNYWYQHVSREGFFILGWWFPPDILVSYMLANEILRFLSEMEIDIITGGH